MAELQDSHPPAYRRLMAAACVAMLVFAAANMVPSVCLKEWGAQFHLSFGDRGALSSVRMAANVVVLLFSGFLADRLGKRLFLVPGMGCIVLGMAATAVAGRHAGLLAAQALVGAGTGTLEALVNPMVADLAPQQAGRLLNLTNGVFSIGLVAAALGTGELLQAGGSWRIAFWVCAAPALLGAVLFASRHYPKPGLSEEAGETTGRAGFLRAPAFWLLVVAMFCGGGCEAGMTVWGANFSEHELSASALAGASTVAFFGAFMAVGRFGSGFLLSRVPALRLMIWSAIGCALATAGLVFVQELAGAWILFALGGLFVACFWPTLLAVAADVFSERSSLLFALLAAAGITGCMLLPWGIGLLGDAAGLRAGVALLPASMLVELAVLIGLRRARGSQRS